MTSNDRVKQSEPTRMSCHMLPFYVSAHEAGHCIAHWATGTRFDAVWVRPDGERAGRPYLDRRGRRRDVDGIVNGPSLFLPGAIASSPPEMLPMLRASLVSDGVVLLAGPAAEARSRGWSIAAGLLANRNGDLIDLDTLGAEYDRSNPAEPFVRVVRRTRRRLLRGYWPVTLAVAEALHHRRRLSYEAVLRIIKRETGEGECNFGVLLPRQTPRPVTDEPAPRLLRAAPTNEREPKLSPAKLSTLRSAAR